MYVTLPPVVEVSVCAMVAPLPAACPVTVPMTVPIVQLNVEPEGVLLNAILVVAPLQMAAGVTGVTTGGGFTITVSVVVADKLPLSVTCSVKVEVVAAQLAATVAVTLPLLSTLMPLSVTPEPLAGVAVTLSAFSASSASLTVAMGELLAGAPAMRETLKALMVGAVLQLPVIVIVAP